MRPYLEATDPQAADIALRNVLEREAAPVIHAVIERKRSGGGGGADEQDVASAAREQLIRQLVALRAEERAAIPNFKGYVAAVAYSMWAEHLRAQNPQRSMLLNRVRYLLENRTVQHGFALWEDNAGHKLCGLTKWQDRVESKTTPRLQWLLADPSVAARDAFGRRYWQQFDLATLVNGLFDWLGHPIELRDLVWIVAELLGISDRPEAIDFVDESAADLEGAAPHSPVEELAWKEYLVWLWQKLGELSPAQCASFLLSSSALRELEVQGIASIRTLAPRFKMSAEHLAEIWQRLPLDDLGIAHELRCTRQQVINLRRVARDGLGRAWQEFFAESNTAGNKAGLSSSS